MSVKLIEEGGQWERSFTDFLVFICSVGGKLFTFIVKIKYKALDVTKPEFYYLDLFLYILCAIEKLLKMNLNLKKNNIY